MGCCGGGVWLKVKWVDFNTNNECEYLNRIVITNTQKENIMIPT